MLSAIKKKNFFNANLFAVEFQANILRNLHFIFQTLTIV